MRPIAALATTLVVLFCSFTVSAQSFGPPAPGTITGPRLRLEPANLDLGECYFGDSVSGDLVIINDGTEDLVIAEVKSTCGCTAAPLKESDKVVPPGQRITVPVTMTPKGTASPLTKYLQIKTNDDTTANVSVPVQCRVLVGALAEPNYVLFRDAKIGDTPSQVVRIVSKNDQPFVVSSVEMNTELYTASWDKEAESALVQEITIVKKPVASRTPQATTLTIKTTHPRTSVITMSANTIVKPLLAKSTNRLMYEPIAPGSSGVTQISLWRSDDNSPLETLSVNMPQSPHITFDTERDADDPKLWRITANVPEDETRPVVGSAVWLETNIVGEGPIAMMCVIRIDKTAGGAGTR